VWPPPGGDGMICMILFFWYTATSGGDYRKSSMTWVSRRACNYKLATAVMACVRFPSECLEWTDTRKRSDS
jgi:hypothetical protein